MKLAQGNLAARTSKLRHDVAQPDFQSVGNPQQGVQADPLLSSFHLADIDRMQVGLFSKLFLTQLCLPPVMPDAFADYFSLLPDAGHNP